MKIKEKDKRNIIKFTQEDIKIYLDKCITFWREKRDNMKNSKEDRFMAIYYIDAYQSVRISLFDELKD